MTAEKKVFAGRYYDRWSESYESGLRLRFWFWRLLDRTWREIVLDEGAVVYDMGCGTGKLLEYIHDEYPRAVLYGGDVSEGMLEKAREKFRGTEGRGPILKVVDMNERFPWDDAMFDYVVSTYSFHHSRDAVGTLQEVLRVLKPGGRLYLADLCYPPIINFLVNKIYPRVLRWQAHIEFMSRRKLRRALNEAGFLQVFQKRLSPFAVFSSGVRG